MQRDYKILSGTLTYASFPTDILLLLVKMDRNQIHSLT